MPRDFESRPVMLEQAASVTPPASMDGWPRSGGWSARPAWACVMAHQWDGRWWQIPGTQAGGEKAIARRQQAVRMIAFRHGYSGADLRIIPTVEEGLCFRWRLKLDTDQEVTKIIERLTRKVRRRAKHVERGKRGQ